MQLQISMIKHRLKSFFFGKCIVLSLKWIIFNHVSNNNINKFTRTIMHCNSLDHIKSLDHLILCDIYGTQLFVSAMSHLPIHVLLTFFNKGHSRPPLMPCLAYLLYILNSKRWSDSLSYTIATMPPPIKSNPFVGIV